MIRKNYIRNLFKAILSLVFIAGIVCLAEAQAIPSRHKPYKGAVVAKNNTHINYRNNSNAQTSSTPTYCPVGPVTLKAHDASNNNTINNGVTLTCTSNPFYINADNTSQIVTPCIESEYTSTDAALPNFGKEYVYEGGTEIFCLGPAATGCAFPIDNGYPPFSVLNQYWGLEAIDLNPGLQHDFQFCYNGTTPLLTKVQLQDCWSNDSLSPTTTFTSTTTCFTLTTAANTPIGTAIYSIAPTSGTVALTDYHNGECYITPSLLPAGTYTVTYSFTPPLADSCPTITGIFKFTMIPGFTVNVNSAAICAGSSATLTASGATTPATYSWSPSSGLSNHTGSVVVATPSIASIYTVTGTNIGCAATAMATSTVTVNALPTVSVTSATICAGNTATLTASGTATSYSWNTGATTASITATPTMTTNYTVVGTNANSCANTATATVMVNTLPTITINNATVCAGNTATLTATGATTYTWNTSATGTTITTSPTVTTNYTATGTDIHNCKNTATATVTVNPSIVVTVNSATICAGNSATLTANGASTYNWSPSVGIPTNNTVTATPSTTTIYTVTGTTGVCSATATSTVTVNSLPNITVNSPTICIGSATTLSATGANTYTWNTAAIGATISPSPTVTTSYSVTGTNTVTGCSNEVTSTITVNSPPTITVNSATICVGTGALITANFNVSGVIANTFTFSTGVTGTNLASVGITCSPTVTTAYSVSQTDLTTGCETTATFTVTVNSLPTITVNINPIPICAGVSTTLTATGANTYTWNTNAMGASISSSPTVTTNFTVTGTDINGCVDSTIAIVNVIPPPTVIATGSSPVCLGQTISLSGNTVAGSTYQWSGPNGFTASSQNPLINNATELNAGTYTLTIISSGCSATNTVGVVVDSIPTIAHAGVDTTIYNSSILLTGNVPVIGTGTWLVISGGGTFTNNTIANTQINNLQTGQNILQWTISNGACPASSDSIIIMVKALIIPSGFSPNGDGMNDYFEINGIEEYSNVKLNVFNRWGNEIYESDNYKNDWNGKNMSGENVSDDTYFYTLEIPNKNSIKGYVVLKRK